jgi:DNA end-binding protein Ku
MRGTSYLIAILAHEGALRALTLRYHDEVRSPTDVGLPDLETADVAEVARLQKAMKKLSAKELDTSQLVDRASERLRAAAEKKLAKGTDVHTVPVDEVEPEADDGESVDIMALLRQSLGRGRAVEA